MTVAQLRQFGGMPFSLKVWPKIAPRGKSLTTWATFTLRDRAGNVICCGGVRRKSIPALTAITIDSQRAA